MTASSCSEILEWINCVGDGKSKKRTRRNGRLNAVRNYCDHGEFILVLAPGYRLRVLDREYRTYDPPGVSTLRI